MAELRSELKSLLIEALMLEELEPHDIVDDAPLFGPEGLGLDSVDALELVLEIQRKYGVTIQDNDESRQVLHSIGSLAQHIERQRQTA